MCENLMLLFCKGRHGLVGKCALHVQHACFVHSRPIKFLICDVFVVVRVVDAKAPETGSLRNDEATSTQQINNMISFN